MSQDIGNLVGAMGTVGVDPSEAIFVAGPPESLILATRLPSSFAISVLMSLGPPTRTVAAVSPAADPLASTGQVVADRHGSFAPQMPFSTTL
jgi:hypothetical protein